MKHEIKTRQLAALFLAGCTLGGLVASGATWWALAAWKVLACSG